ncbi:uncharacterized protein C8orf58 homolog isoform X2 [Choloepus didactylus]|uniref:uncharacterized protein C8orf58 homolog isoform X2 n=1 Tax=Choloepus didactylus TaxID=27675 RepID=UPI0018A0D2D4|nr:uncharacterized protein C8orf58 homolog isoform X2 [Choloepus didactylus]
MLGALGMASLILRLLTDGAGEELTHSCVVPGVISTYRRIQDAANQCPSEPGDGGGELTGLGRQVPLLKLASQDSGVEMAVGDISLATSPGLSQDSLDFEPVGSPEPLVLAAVEPPGQLDRLLASRKLEQVLERSRQLPISSASLSRHHRPLQLLSETECEVPLFGAGEQEAIEAETDLEAGLEEAEVMGRLEPEAWATLPGQGLRYLEYLCLVLEHMARLQQLYLQLQTQRPQGVSEPLGGQDPEEEEAAVAPSPSSPRSPGNEVQEPWELLSQTKETGGKAAAPSKGGVLSANLASLPEAPAEPNHPFPSSQGHKVKVLLNRIRWRRPRHPEPPGPPEGPTPRVESRDLLERPQCHPIGRPLCHHK